MNEALVVILVFLWAVALLPSVLRSTRSNTHATVGGFERAMDVLRHRPDGRYLMVPEDASRFVDEQPAVYGTGSLHRSDPHLERRRRLFGRLVGLTAASWLMAFIWGGPLWIIASLSFLGLGGYAAVLRRWKLQREEAREVVRHLPTVDDQAGQEFGGRAVLDRRVVGEPMFAGVRRGEDSGNIQVANHPDEPWRPQAGVRIRRWDE